MWIGYVRIVFNYLREPALWAVCGSSKSAPFFYTNSLIRLTDFCREQSSDYARVETLAICQKQVSRQGDDIDEGTKIPRCTHDRAFYALLFYSYISELLRKMQLSLLRTLFKDDRQIHQEIFTGRIIISIDKPNIVI